MPAPPSPPPEEVMFEANPKMFRQAPFLFVLSAVLVPLVVGLVILVIWWLNAKSQQLTVTDKRTIVRRGILSKHTNEVLHRDIRNVQVMQTFSQRLFGVGDIGISSAGQSDIEIAFRGLATPYRVRDLVDQHRAL